VKVFFFFGEKLILVEGGRCSVDVGEAGWTACNIPSVIFTNAELLNKYHSGDQIMNTEMGRACSTYGGEKRCIQCFGGKI
jgi:hypothetical protein